MSKKSYFILVQNTFENGVIFEKQIFGEAIAREMLYCIQEEPFFGLKGLLARRKVQKLTGNMFNSYIIHSSKLYKTIREEKQNRTLYIIFLNSLFAMVRFPEKSLLYLKKKYNIKLILYYLDSIERPVSTYANYLREKKVFDIIFSFDKKDCEDYNLQYWPTPYSKINIEEDEDIQYDLYFCGVEEGRKELLKQIIWGQKARIKADISSKENKTDFENREYKTASKANIYTVSYDRVIKNILHTNCILDIVRPGQIGLSVRPYEAITYNKKLLTNNKEILNFPYYNENYIHLFSEYQDIDWDWVRSEEQVEYHYRGDYSPLRFLKKIEEVLKLIERGEMN